MPTDFSTLATHESSWLPEECRATLNCRLEGRIVPSMHAPEGVRLDTTHLVVLDDFFGEPERQGLLASLAGSGVPQQGPPQDRWARNTADGAHGSKTWGLREEVLEEMARAPTAAMLEIQTRLVKLYPDYIVAHMPSAQMQALTGNGGSEHKSGTVEAESEVSTGEEPRNEGSPKPETAVDCCNLLANAPVHGDHYDWHVDADPLTLPACEYRSDFGDYCNREPGMPLLVSLLLYLVDEQWDRGWHAETLFLDSASDVGIVVRPKRYRAVLMDQDVLHRVVAPSSLASGRPRYSLVWKLAFLPRQPDQACCIAKAEWGPPSSIGSAARLDAVKRAVAANRQRGRDPNDIPKKP